MSKGSSAPAPHKSTGDVLSDLVHAVEHALRLPERPSSRWHRAGLSRRAERILDLVGGLVLLLLTGGWLWTILGANGNEAYAAGVGPRGSRVASALTDPRAPSTAFLTSAALEAFTSSRGASGKLRVAISGDTMSHVPDSVPGEGRVVYSQGGEVDTTSRPRGAGVWRVALAVGNIIKPITDFSLITLRPASEQRSGRIGLYYVGRWPSGRGPARAPPGKYAAPRGFIEVTPQNQNTFVSEHFQLRHFLTRNQPNVWPKYLVLRLELLDKLELVLSDLEERGIDVSGVRVLSGFRTPQYNESGGNPAGRADLSRHMYGDAADIYLDSDGNGVMDDLDNDGRSTIRDARVIEAAVDRVERAHPELIGGTGVYPAAPGHGPFIHIDTRGYRARWTES